MSFMRFSLVVLCKLDSIGFEMENSLRVSLPRLVMFGKLVLTSETFRSLVALCAPDEFCFQPLHPARRLPWDFRLLT